MPVIPLVPLNSLSTADDVPAPLPVAPYAVAAVIAWLLRLEEMPPIEFGTKADMDVKPGPWPVDVVPECVETPPVLPVPLPPPPPPFDRVEVKADE